MDKKTIGTKLAIASTTVACLPSLISLYYDRMGLGKPPIDLLKYFTTLHVIYRSPRFKFCSNLNSILIHLFHHMDIHHLKANLLCLASSGLSANLGFFGTIHMLLAGGIIGLTIDIIDRCKARSNTLAILGRTSLDVINNPMPTNKNTENMWNWFYTKIANPELVNYVARTLKPKTNVSSTVFSICGLDAAVCAIIGVDAYKLYKESGTEISDAWNDALGLKRSNGHFHIVGRMGIMVTEIATLVLEPHVKKSRRLYGEERHVGVTGRVASFLFGFTTYAVYDLARTQWRKHRHHKRNHKKIKKRIAKDVDGREKPFKSYTINDDYFF
ncbi:hypothetical protein H8356DRAFT_1715229 [Neocallimastix lanati (nom. inval.)]|jgi:hypothetical protein|uniref:Uncharacterized protein n=1 Tax=Neocallimastix californiae TaxID=1754190 RepID=A0A1Y2AQ76_9FUNG|nr:hypothetical protein H8356DRAFT_1715229 [Neocallimastix sp. JGI-2020a]ORY24723.1 hypothetical protein LY90DRAFT_675090 [Neocallimastix californiae]|eukprot:ORY24723.1 hypothetical protein LY90DRAFT_675090 [Neocallimastix californiae]